MDFKNRIAEATRYRDQTHSRYKAAQGQVKSSQKSYDASFKTAPQFQTVFDQAKNKYYDTEEISDMKNSWQTAKDSVDAIRTSTDKLGDSINQQFGGTSLTQAQRDMAKQKQLMDLNKQFTQYDANYQAQFANYNQTVDKAFDTSLDVANKNYDSYWDGVRMKFDTWQTNIKNEEKWEKMYSTSKSQLHKTELAYDNWKFEQDLMREQREFEQWQNDFSARQRTDATNSARYSADYAERQAKNRRDAKQRFSTDTALFQQGKMSSSEYMRRMDAGRYR